MPLMGSRGGGSVRGFGRFGKNLLLALVDVFSRSGSIGESSSSDGKGIWKSLSGNWSTTGSRATASTNGSLAAIDLDGKTITDLRVDIPNGDGGVGPAFWVQDSSNFYSAYPTYNQSSSFSSYTQCSGRYDSGSGSGCGENNGSFMFWQAFCCNGASAYLNPCSNPYAYCTSIGSSDCGSNHHGYGSRCYESRDTIVVETITYTSTFSLAKNGTVISSQNYSSNTSGYSRGYSIVASTSGDSISAVLYSSTNAGGSSLSTRSSNEVSPVKGFGVGIYKTSSTRLQGSELDNLSVTATP